MSDETLHGRCIAICIFISSVAEAEGVTISKVAEGIVKIMADENSNKEE